MILLDTGPLVALFDPRDADHVRCREQLAAIHERVVTTSPVLTEAFYFLEGTRGASALRQFVRDSGIALWPLDDERLRRCLDLMEEYEDHPMGLADASLVAAAETLRVVTAWTLDQADFLTYRPRIGRKLGRFRTL